MTELDLAADHVRLLRETEQKHLACDPRRKWWTVDDEFQAYPLGEQDGSVADELRSARLIRADLREQKLVTLFWSLQLFRPPDRGEQCLARAEQESQR